jgi:phosphopantothenoylcysteine synthetase/decarboxylase
MRIRFIITAGGTREPIDEVRYIGNTSTGRLGAAVADEALGHGHEVVFIHGRDSALPAGEAVLEGYTTSAELAGALERQVRAAKGPACVVHAAAVADYVPQRQGGKIPSGSETLTLVLKRAPKIVDRIKSWNPDVFLVKFKLEANRTRESLIEAGEAAGRKSGAHLVVANDVARIKGQAHPAFILRPGKEPLEAGTKAEIARLLVAEVEACMKKRSSSE